MSKTQIEWCDYTINPIKGLCPVACPYCYARRLYDRFGWNPEIRYTDPGFTIAELQSIKKPSKIFWGSTMELFWDWPEIWLRDTFKIVEQFPQHTHIFLTKRPENLIKWTPFPENVWVGVSAVTNFYLIKAMHYLKDVKANIKFVSMEPLLRWRPTENMTTYSHWLKECGISWVIIGQQTPTSQKTCPEYRWIEDIVSAADKAGAAVFIKDNLNACAIGDHPSLVDECGRLRQEFPIAIRLAEEVRTK